MKALDLIDRWIFQAYRPCAASLPLLRIFVALYLLIFHANWYGWLGDAPLSLFHPTLSLAMYFSDLPPGWCFRVLDVFMAFGAACLLFGVRTRFTCFALCAGMIIGNSFRYSIGPKIDHDILLPATLFCLGLSHCGDWLSRDETRLRDGMRQRTSWPITFLMLIAACSMLTAVLPKLFSGWLDPSVHACRGHMISNLILNDRDPYLANILLNIQSPLFWKLADWSTLVIEGGFIFCCFSLTAMRIAVMAATFFHVLIYFSMDIFFITNLIAYLSLVDLRIPLRFVLVRRVVRHFHRWAQRISLTHLLGVAAFSLVVSLLIERLGWSVALSVVFSGLGALAALFIALGYLIHLLVRATKYKKSHS